MPVCPEPVHHVHHKELVADPVGTVAALYRHFGLTLAPVGRRSASGDYAEAAAERRLRPARTTASRIMGWTAGRSARNSAPT